MKGFHMTKLYLRGSGGDIPYNSLVFDSSPAGNRLSFSLAKPLELGEILRGRVINAGEDTLLFTCRVVHSSPSQGAYALRAQEPYAPLFNKPLAPCSYRRLSIKEILGDILETLGVADFDLSQVPPLKLSRFSFTGESGRKALGLLLETYHRITGETLQVAPSPQGTFLCGEGLTLDPGVKVHLKGGENIIKQEGSALESFLYPVLSGQKIWIDGEPRICIRSILRVKPGKQRLRMEVVS